MNKQTVWILVGVAAVVAFMLWRRRQGEGQGDEPTTGGGFGGKFPSY